MCDVVTMIGLSVAQTAAQFIGESQAADAQAEFQNQRLRQTEEAALQARNLQLAQLDQRNRQEDIAASQDTLAAQRDGARARAQARVAAGEAGVAGLSVDALVNDFYRQEATIRDRISQTREFGRQQSAFDAQGITAQAQNRVNAAAPQPVQGPSLLGAGLQAAGNAASIYNEQVIQPQRRLELIEQKYGITPRVPGAGVAGLSGGARVNGFSRQQAPQPWRRFN